MNGARSDIEELRRSLDELRSAIAARMVGLEDIVEDVLTGFFAGGHVLIEGPPGLGKTQLVHHLAAALGLRWSRIQFTPDLMPSDVTGTRVVRSGGGQLDFEFEPGPLFAQIVLADEINRATPKTQSALLEAMQEQTVTVGNETHQLPDPFCVIATQNPIELEGTFPLPEAQLDRFLLHIKVGRPSVEDLVEVLDRTTGDLLPPPTPILTADQVLRLRTHARSVLCARELLQFTAVLIATTDPDQEDAEADTKRFVRYAASPRAAQAIVKSAKVRALLAGRPSVELSDLERSVESALRHRVILNYEAEGDGVRTEDLIPGWVKRARKVVRL
ncbi:MAG: AAA family ATPase [Planctomycetota bacterium]